MTVDLRRGGPVVPAVLAVAVVVVMVALGCVAEANVVFKVQHKFGPRAGVASALARLKHHDAHRHRRILASIDLPLGGNGLATDTALYYTKLSIGTPPKDYHVQVDTGSDILWVNCAGCDKCPTKSSLDIDLTRYDLKASSTGKTVTCDQDFCSSIFNSPFSDCKVGMLCEFSVTYGDGSQTAGYFVRDNLKLDQVSGNLETTSMNGSIAFGCSSKQHGELGSSSEAVDGILGFGQANSSLISQLASSGKVKKIFSHCLDSENGGGIFAMGEVVEPKVKTTPMIADQPHYNIIMKSIEVGGSPIDVPTDTFDAGSGSGTIVDSGTTLAYLPTDIYDSLKGKVLGAAPGLKTHTVEEQFKCFFYSGNIDHQFPVVKFQFENSATFNVYPHDYLFQVRDGEWCIGWQRKSMQTREGKQVILLGDMVLADKLIVYDLEKETIGWTDYNCSSSIKVKDDGSGHTYSVAAHDLSSVCRLCTAKFLTFLSIVMLCYLIE